MKVEPRDSSTVQTPVWNVYRNIVKTAEGDSVLYSRFMFKVS